MRKIPLPNNHDSEYQSLTANDLIILLRDLDPETVIMAYDGTVIHHLVPDKTVKDVVYLSHIPVHHSRA